MRNPKDIYEIVGGAGYELGDFDTFVEDMNDSENVAKLHEAIKDDTNIKVPSLSVFETALKKKDQPQQGNGSKEPTEASSEPSDANVSEQDTVPVPDCPDGQIKDPNTGLCIPQAEYNSKYPEEEEKTQKLNYDVNNLKKSIKTFEEKSEAIKEISNIKSKAEFTKTPFENKEEGNTFREFVHYYDPEWAKANDLDKNHNQYDNVNMRKAYKKFGGVYSTAFNEAVNRGTTLQAFLDNETATTQPTDPDLPNTGSDWLDKKYSYMISNNYRNYRKKQDNVPIYFHMDENAPKYTHKDALAFENKVTNLLKEKRPELTKENIDQELAKFFTGGEASFFRNIDRELKSKDYRDWGEGNYRNYMEVMVGTGNMPSYPRYKDLENLRKYLDDNFGIENPYLEEEFVDYIGWMQENWAKQHAFQMEQNSLESVSKLINSAGIPEISLNDYKASNIHANRILTKEEYTPVESIIKANEILNESISDFGSSYVSEDDKLRRSFVKQIDYALQRGASKDEVQALVNQFNVLVVDDTKLYNFYTGESIDELELKELPPDQQKFITETNALTEELKYIVKRDMKFNPSGNIRLDLQNKRMRAYYELMARVDELGTWFSDWAAEARGIETEGRMDDVAFKMSLFQELFYQGSPSQSIDDFFEFYTKNISKIKSERGEIANLDDYGKLIPDAIQLKPLPVTYDSESVFGDIISMFYEEGAKGNDPVLNQIINNYNNALQDFIVNNNALDLNLDFKELERTGFLDRMYLEMVRAMDSSDPNRDNVIYYNGDDLAKRFADQQREMGYEISPEMQKRLELTFTDKLADAMGGSIPVMAEIMLVAWATGGLGLTGEAGLLATTWAEAFGTSRVANLVGTMLEQGLIFAPTSETFATGVGEGAGMGVYDMTGLDKLMKKSPLGLVVSSILRTGFAGLGETVQEYSGEFVNRLSEDEQIGEAFRNTFISEDPLEKLAITYTMSTLMGGASVIPNYIEARNEMRKELLEADSDSELVKEVQNSINKEMEMEERQANKELKNTPDSELNPEEIKKKNRVIEENQKAKIDIIGNLTPEETQNMGESIGISISENELTVSPIYKINGEEVTEQELLEKLDDKEFLSLVADPTVEVKIETENQSEAVSNKINQVFAESPELDPILSEVVERVNANLMDVQGTEPALRTLEEEADVEKSKKEKLEKPFITLNDGSGKMVTVTTETTEKDGIKKTKFKTETTNKKGEPRTQNNKGYNTFEEAVENLDIDLEDEINETALELVETLKEVSGKETLVTKVEEIREDVDESSPYFGTKSATIVVGGQKIDFRLKSDADVTEESLEGIKESKKFTEEEIEEKKQEAPFKSQVEEQVETIQEKIKGETAPDQAVSQILKDAPKGTQSELEELGVIEKTVEQENYEAAQDKYNKAKQELDEAAPEIEELEKGYLEEITKDEQGVIEMLDKVGGSELVEDYKAATTEEKTEILANSLPEGLSIQRMAADKLEVDKDTKKLQKKVDDAKLEMDIAKEYLGKKPYQVTQQFKEAIGFDETNQVVKKEDVRNFIQDRKLKVQEASYGVTKDIAPSVVPVQANNQYSEADLQAVNAEINKRQKYPGTTGETGKEGLYELSIDGRDGNTYKITLHENIDDGWLNELELRDALESITERESIEAAEEGRDVDYEKIREEVAQEVYAQYIQEEIFDAPGISDNFIFISPERAQKVININDALERLDNGEITQDQLDAIVEENDGNKSYSEGGLEGPFLPRLFRDLGIDTLEDYENVIKQFAVTQYNNRIVAGLDPTTKKKLSALNQEATYSAFIKNPENAENYRENLIYTDPTSEPARPEAIQELQEDINKLREEQNDARLKEDHLGDLLQLIIEFTTRGHLNLDYIEAVINHAKENNIEGKIINDRGDIDFNILEDLVNKKENIKEFAKFLDINENIPPSQIIKKANELGLDADTVEKFTEGIAFSKYSGGSYGKAVDSYVKTNIVGFIENILENVNSAPNQTIQRRISTFRDLTDGVLPSYYEIMEEVDRDERGSLILADSKEPLRLNKPIEETSLYDAVEASRDLQEIVTQIQEPSNFGTQNNDEAIKYVLGQAQAAYNDVKRDAYDKKRKKEDQLEALNNQARFISHNWDKTRTGDERGVNVAIHTRTTNRETTQGEAVHFIDELQSDWQQESDVGMLPIGKRRQSSEIENDLAEVVQQDPFLKEKLDELVQEKIKNNEETRIKGRTDVISLIFDYSNIAEDTQIPDIIQAEVDITNAARDYIRDLKRTDKVKSNLLQNLIREYRNSDTKKKLPSMPFKSPNQVLGIALRRELKRAADEGINIVALTTGKQIQEVVDGKIEGQEYYYNQMAAKQLVKEARRLDKKAKPIQVEIFPGETQIAIEITPKMKEKLVGKKLPLFSKIKKTVDDKADQKWLSSQEQVGEELVEGRPDQRPSVETTQTGRVLQEQASGVGIPKVEEAIEVSKNDSETIDDQIALETNEGKKTVLERVKKVYNALKKIDPNMRIVVHKTNDSYSKAYESAGGDIAESLETKGFFNRGKEIHINLNSATSETAFHEGAHKVLQAVLQNNPELLSKFEKDLRNILPKDLIEKYDSMAGMYSDMDRSEEFIVHFLADVADGAVDLKTLPKSVLSKLIEIFNKLIEKIGLDSRFVISSLQDVQEFAEKMANAFTEGVELDVTALTREETKRPEGFEDATKEWEGVEEKLQEVAEKRNEINLNTKEATIKKSKIGAFKVGYYIDSEESKKLEDQGKIVYNYDINEIPDGTIVAVHQPDNMMVGEVKIGDKEVAKGEGGVFYVLNTGNVWASANLTTAKKISNKINDSLKKSPDGVGRLLLGRGSTEKLISSVGGVKGSMNILFELVNNNILSKSDFRKALSSVGKKYGINFDGRTSTESIYKDIQDKFMNVSNSSFPKRGSFLQDFITELGKSASAKKNIKKVREFLGSEKRITFSKAGISEAIATILTERLLLGLPSSHLYASIEVTEPTVALDTKENESYPAIIKTVSGERPVLKILSERPNVQDALTTTKGETAQDLGTQTFGGKIGFSQIGYGTARVVTKGKANNLGGPMASRIKKPKRKWTPSLTQSEVDQKLKEAGVQTYTENNNILKTENRGNETQRNNITTYEKLVNGVNEKFGDDVQVLDYGAGLGIGAKAASKLDMNYKTFEPFHDAKKFKKYSGQSKPNFTEATSIPSQSADVIVQNAVLNVVPADIRQSIIENMGRVLKPGGTMYISVRGMGDRGLTDALSNAKKGKGKNIFLSDSEYYVPTTQGDYQKGFTIDELINYVQDVLGPQYHVEQSRESFFKSDSAKVRIKVTKKQGPMASRIKKSDEQNRADEIRKKIEEKQPLTRMELEFAIDRGIIDSKEKSKFEKQIREEEQKAKETLEDSVKRPESPVRKFSKRIGLSKWIPQKVKDFLERTRYKPLSNEDLKKFANDMVDLIDREATAEGRTQESIGDKYLSELKEFGSEMSMANLIAVGLEMQERLNTIGSVTDSELIHKQQAEILDHLAELGTKLGQGVQAFKLFGGTSVQGMLNFAKKQLVKKGKMSEEEFKKRIPELLKLIDKIKKAPEGFQKGQAAADFSNYIIRLNPPSAWDVGLNIWYNNILSGWTTQGVNAVSTLINGMLNLGSALTVNTVQSVFVKNKPNYALNYIYGVLTGNIKSLRGIQKGLIEAMSIIRTGITKNSKFQEVQDIMDNVDFGNYKIWQQALLRPMNFLSLFGQGKYVSRFMKATDAFFYETFAEQKAYMVAMDAAKEKGLRGRALAEDVYNTMYGTKEQQQKAREQASKELGERGDTREDRRRAASDQAYNEGLGLVEKGQKLDDQEAKAKTDWVNYRNSVNETLNSNQNSRKQLQELLDRYNQDLDSVNQQLQEGVELQSIEARKENLENEIKNIKEQIKSLDTDILIGQEKIKEADEYLQAFDNKELGIEGILIQKGYNPNGTESEVKAYKEEAARLKKEKGIEAYNKRVKELMRRDSASKYKRRVFEILQQNRPEGFAEKTHNFASKGTYNYEPKGQLGVIAESIGQLTRDIPALRFIFPFTRIVANVTNESLEYFPPVGLKRAVVGMRGEEKSVENRADHLAKAILGLTLMTGLAIKLLVDDDDDPYFSVTGAGPKDRKKYYALLETGWRPYSVKIGDTYVSYKYTPLNIALAAIGTAKDHMLYDKETKEVDDDALSVFSTVFSSMMFNSASTILDQSFLSSGADFLEALGRGEASSEKLVKTILRPAKSFFVPNLFTQAERQINPTIYDAEGYGEWAIKQMPILPHYLLKPKLNIFGEPIQATTNPFWNHKKGDNPELQWMVDNRYWPSLPNEKQIFTADTTEGSLGFTEMTPDEVYEMSLMAGPEIKKIIQRYMQMDESGELDKMKDQGINIENEIRHAIEMTREQAKTEMEWNKAFKDEPYPNILAEANEYFEKNNVYYKRIDENRKKKVINDSDEEIFMPTENYMNAWKNTHNSFNGYLVDWVMKYGNGDFNKAVENYEKRLQGSAVDYLVGDGEGGILGKIKNKYIHDEQMKILGIEKPKALVDKEKELIRDGVFFTYPSRNSASGKAFEINDDGDVVEVVRYDEKISNVRLSFDWYKKQQETYIKNYNEALTDEDAVDALEDAIIDEIPTKVIYEKLITNSSSKSRKEINAELFRQTEEEDKDFRDYSKKTD